jgi:hypothetical protein
MVRVEKLPLRWRLSDGRQVERQRGDRSCRKHLFVIHEVKLNYTTA